MKKRKSSTNLLRLYKSRFKEANQRAKLNAWDKLPKTDADFAALEAAKVKRQKRQARNLTIVNRNTHVGQEQN